YINVDVPRRCNDSSVYSRSSLAEVIEHQIYSGRYMITTNTPIQSHLITDSAFALSSTLLKPYAK
ncbi:unnamed protein product, partial [Rotaria sordida]